MKWGNGWSGIMSLSNQFSLNSDFKLAGTLIEPYLWGASFAGGISRLTALMCAINILQDQAFFGMHSTDSPVVINSSFKNWCFAFKKHGGRDDDTC